MSIDFSQLMSHLPKIVSVVSNDIVTDNRIHKIAISLTSSGYNVHIIGRKFRDSPDIPVRPYSIRRFRLWFTSGPLFYINMNIRYFFHLLGSDLDIILSNDLDTLPACWLASVFRRNPLIFDSHELFPEVPELVHRRMVRKIWLFLERYLVKRIDYGMTVCTPIAEYYKKKYNKDFEVVRNDAHYREAVKKSNIQRTIIYQGVLNVGRGLELAIAGMKHLENVKLLIIGEGDISNKLKKLVAGLDLSDKVEFTGRLPLEQVGFYTGNASIGISLEEDIGLNYRYALPNKLFDYIQARIPVIASDLPEISNIIVQYKIGKIITKRTPEEFSAIVMELLEKEIPSGMYVSGLDKAAIELCWEKEEEKLLKLFKNVLATC